MNVVAITNRLIEINIQSTHVMQKLVFFIGNILNKEFLFSFKYLASAVKNKNQTCKDSGCGFSKMLKETLALRVSDIVLSEFQRVPE